MSLSLFKFFELYSREFFFVVGGEEVHILVSVCPSLLFGSFYDAFGLLFLFSLAVFKLLGFLMSNESRSLIGDNKVIRGDRHLGRFDLEEFGWFVGCALRGDFWGFFLQFFLHRTLENYINLCLKRVLATGFWFWQAILLKLSLVYVYLRII
jgi:hypothetical protein